MAKKTVKKEEVVEEVAVPKQVEEVAVAKEPVVLEFHEGKQVLRREDAVINGREWTITYTVDGCAYSELKK